MKGVSLQFRPDIEGLRGISVLMVVLAHAGIPGFSGGFVGVDVFFVISGFLITGLLKREIEANGRLRFGAFYAKRVRRLLPALAAMLAGTMILSAALLPTRSWALQAEGMKWAALWLSNIYFATEQFGYFGPAATDSIHLHTWSLGVEEQFYLFWPALVAVLWMLGGNRALRSGVLLLVLAGFAASIFASQLLPVHAYYQTPLRIWQFAAGGLLNFLGSGAVLSGARARALRLGGLATILCCCFLLDPARVGYPGWWALLPTAAAMSLLVPVHAGVLDGALENAGARFFGRISYSLYLWHWPLMVMGFALAGKSAFVGGVVAVLALVPAWVSWRWFELRRPDRAPSPLAWISAGVIGSLLLAALAHAWSVRAPAAEEGVEDATRRAMATLALPKLYMNPECDEWYSDSRVVPCLQVEASTAGAPSVVLVGDSVGAQWAPALEAIARRNGWSFIVLTKSSCPIVDREFFYERIRRPFVECETWRSGVVDYVRESKPDMVVIGSTAGYGDAFGVDGWELGTVDFLQRIHGKVGRIRILAPSPILSFSPPDCVASGARRRFPTCSQPLSEVEPVMITDGLQRAAAAVPGVRLVETSDLVCPNGVCAAVDRGVLTYRDPQHLNSTYVARLSEELETRLF